MSEATEKLRYASVPIEPELFDALGLDPAEAGVREIRRALDRYRVAIAGARRKLGETFTRAELNLMADVMNGTWLIGSWIDSVRVHLMANIQDSQWPEDRDGTRSSSGFADKWFGDGRGDAATKALLSRLKRAPDLTVTALGLAIRDFWRDPAADADSNWWLPAGGGEK